MSEKVQLEKYRKKWTILGISIWKLYAYFIIYSFLGYIIETIFGIMTKGVWESRQSFLYGPFLGIYGVGAIAIILFSKYFNKNNFTLFLGGFIIGSATEYIISYLTEAILETQWWDYSNYILSVNGRICLLYSVFWGILTVFLVKKFNPLIDRFANYIKNKISIKALKLIVASITVFLAIDCILTCYAQDMFINRLVVENNIQMENTETIIVSYNRINNNKFLKNIVNKFWGNEKMIRTFPNIKIQDKNNNTIYLDSLLPEIQPYYLKIFDKK